MSITILWDSFRIQEFQRISYISFFLLSSNELIRILNIGKNTFKKLTKSNDDLLIVLSRIFESIESLRLGSTEFDEIQNSSSLLVFFSILFLCC